MKKFTTILLLACLGVFLVSCNQPQTPSTTPDPTKTEGEENKDTVAEDTANGEKIIMATNPEFPPFEYIVEGDKGVVGSYDGIDLLIAVEIAKDLNKELSVEAMDFEAIIPAVKSGKADFSIAGMTIKPDRLENVDFSEPYWVAVQTIIVKSDNTEIVDAKSLKGKKVGVVTGYTGDTVVSEMDGVTVERYKKGIDAVMDLNSSRLDAVVIDSPTANRFISKFQDLKGVVDPIFETEEYAIAVAKGNTELLDKINTTIKRLKDNGDIERFAEEIDARYDAE